MDNTESRYSKLDLMIIGKYNTYQNFADKLGMSRMNLYKKLNKKTEWKREDITKCCLLLDIKPEEVYELFFD